jgi:hypothetical protein
LTNNITTLINSFDTREWQQCKWYINYGFVVVDDDDNDDDDDDDDDYDDDDDDNNNS